MLNFVCINIYKHKSSFKRDKNFINIVLLKYVNKRYNNISIAATKCKSNE